MATALFRFIFRTFFFLYVHEIQYNQNMINQTRLFLTLFRMGLFWVGY